MLRRSRFPWLHTLAARPRATWGSFSETGKIASRRAAATSGRRLRVERLEDRWLLAAAGDFDLTFDGDGKAVTDFGFDEFSVRIVLQPDGKIVAMGTSSQSDVLFFALARYNADGSLDPSFSGDGKVATNLAAGHERANSIALQADGKIVVAGDTFAGSRDFIVARYNTDGSLDLSFDGDGFVMTSLGDVGDNNPSVAVQPDGKIILAGTTGMSSSSTGLDFGLVRYNSNGSLDTSFDGDGIVTTNFSGGSSDQTFNMVVQPDGKILVVGFSGIGSNADFAIARYNSDGSPDTSFDGDGKLTTAFGTAHDFAIGVALQSDGKIVVSGSSHNGSNNDFALARYNANGSLDTTLDGDGKLTTAIGAGDDAAPHLALQPDGKIILAGITGSLSAFDIAMARYHANGSLDTTFSGDGKLITAFGPGNDTASSIALQPDGKIVIGGQIDQIENPINTDFLVVRYESGLIPADYNRDGSVDAADYVLWRKQLGTTGVPAYSGADGDGNTAVEQADYGVWTARFGETAGAGSGEQGAGSGGQGARSEERGASSDQRAEQAADVRHSLTYGVVSQSIGASWAEGPHLATARSEQPNSLPEGEETASQFRDDGLLAWVASSRDEVEDPAFVDGGLVRDDDVETATDDAFAALDANVEPLALIYR